MEHLHHFGLSHDPFSNEPDLRFYFESASHRDAQRRVERGLRQHKALTLLTGEGGMGKTLLARRILEALEEEVFEASLLVMMPGAADATGILMRFARQLGVDEPAIDRSALLGQIYDCLAIVREDGRHAVLLIDDAQIMQPEVLSELGGLLNLEYEDRRLLSMLLIGSPELDRLIQNDLGLAPRVEVRVRLQALEAENASAYVAHRLQASNANTDVFPAAALDALYKFGRGRPRLLNTLADNALFEAYLAGRTAIEAGDIERAASDLGVGADPGMTFIAPTPGPVLDVAMDVIDDFSVASEEPPAPLAAPASVPNLEPLDEEFEPSLDLDPALDMGTPHVAAEEPMSLELPPDLLSDDAAATPHLEFGPELELSSEIGAPIDDVLEFESLSFASDPVEIGIEEAEFSSADDGEPLEAAFVELIDE